MLALDIYKVLLSGGLINNKDEKNKLKHFFCFNTIGKCSLAFKIQENKLYCNNCGGQLISGKEISSQKLKEDDMAVYLADKLNKIGYQTSIFKRKLLNRSIYIVQLEDKKEQITLLPLTTSLKNEQLDVLKLRYPNLLALTSRDNLEDFRVHDIMVEQFYEMVYLINKNKNRDIAKIFSEVSNDSYLRIKRYANDVLKTIKEKNYYKDKNKVCKNLGAELFEAHCSLLLGYIFANSIWLGAKTRGKAYPDGLTAFPITSIPNGCFVWDSKYSDINKATLGSINKNKKYITDATRFTAIKNNGGIKSFVFLSNGEPPKNFQKKFSKLCPKRRIKTIFIKFEQ